MRLKELREQAGLQSKKLAKLARVDAGMMSKFEHFKCLPTPATMDLICKALNADVSEIYDAKERLFTHTKKAHKKPKPTDKYRLTVDLPIEAQEFIKKALPACGYKDITYWVYRCYERLQAEYIAKQRYTEEKTVHISEDYEHNNTNFANGYDFYDYEEENQ